jgi:vacuole morphology and inheritance protein 14
VLNFLDDCRKYLSDPNPDVKIATETVLSDFLREIKHIARVQHRISQDQSENQGNSNSYTSVGGAPTTRRISDFHASTSYPGLRRRASKNTINTEISEHDSVGTGIGTNPDGGDGSHTYKGVMSPDVGYLDELREEDGESGNGDTSVMTYQHENDGEDDDKEPDEHAAWIPGQGVYVDHACIIDIMIHHLSYPGQSFRSISCMPLSDYLALQWAYFADEQIQLIALRWIASFLTFAEDVVVPFAPRLIPAILPNLAHHVSVFERVGGCFDCKLIREPTLQIIHSERRCGDQSPTV